MPNSSGIIFDPGRCWSSSRETWKLSPSVVLRVHKLGFFFGGGAKCVSKSLWTWEKWLPLAKKVLLKQEERERTSGDQNVPEREALSKGLPSFWKREGKKTPTSLPLSGFTNFYITCRHFPISPGHTGKMFRGTQKNLYRYGMNEA